MAKLLIIPFKPFVNIAIFIANIKHVFETLGLI